MFKQVNRRLTAALMALAVVISNVITPVAPAFAKDQGSAPGNNGTVKINDQEAVDDPGNQNEPKLSTCTIEVRWYGYDEGLRTSTIDFATQGNVNYQIVSPVGPQDATFTAPTPANGNTLSHEARYTLSFSGAPETNGYHVKVTVNTDGTQGNDKKSKVVWLPASCGPTMVTPDFTLTGNCGVNNDTVTVTKSDDYISSSPLWSNGSVAVTFTMNNGVNKLFPNGQAVMTITKTELTGNCVITSLPKSTLTGVCGLNNDTIIVGEETSQYSAGVASAFVNGVAIVAYTAKSGFVFANNSSSYVETIHESNTNPICIPTKPDDYTTTTTKTTTICLPGGSGKTITLTTVNAYTYKLIFNKWVSILTSSKTTAQTTNASEIECPTPKQINPICDTLGSLILPAYKDGIPGVKHTYYVWVNGVKTSYSASSDVVVANIPQGATVEVKLYINGTQTFGFPIYKHTFTFSTSNCIATPVKPQITDCEAILPITLGITYKKVYLDANDNIVDASQAGVIATRQGVLATVNAGYELSTSNLEDGSYLYMLDFSGMTCGEGGVTPPTVTPPVVTTTSATLPNPKELPHTGSSLGGLLVTLLATLSTYGVVYFLQPKRR